jgi:hypothetical protein
MKFTFACTEAKRNALRLLDLTRKEGLQPGDPKWDGTPVTHCNEYLYEAAVLLGFDCYPLLNPKGIGWTNANDMYRNAREKIVNDNMITHDALSAQKAVNRGRFVAVLAYNIYDGSGHVAAVIANSGLFKNEDGPRIAQAGSENGGFWLNDIFKLKSLSAPIFVELERL